MSNRRVSLPVGLSIPQQFPSRLSPPTPSSPASPATRRSLPTSPICRRSLPSTPRTISPRRLNKLLPDVDEHFASTSSSSETSPRRVKKRRPPPRYQYSLQTNSTMHSNLQKEEKLPEGTLRSFSIKNDQVIDEGCNPMIAPINHNKDRRATCPEVWLCPDIILKPTRHILMRVYGSKNCGKKTLLNCLDQYISKLTCRYNNDQYDDDDYQSKMLNFILNDEQIELEILLESALEIRPFSTNFVLYAIVYSVDNRESFIYSTSMINRLLSRNICRNSNIILIGNKVDLKRNTVVTNMEGSCVAKIHKCRFAEISSLLSMNISELWDQILKQIQNPISTTSQLSSGSQTTNWMNKIVNRGKQLAHSAEQMVTKIVH